MTATIANLQTTIANNTANTMSFGFVPPHGVLLAPYEQYSFVGPISALWTNPNGTVSKRKRDSVQAALLSGQLAIVSTPANVYNDATTGAVKINKLNNGTFAEADPSWGPYETLLTGSFSSPLTSNTATISSATLSFSSAVTGFTSHTQITLTANGTPVTLSGSNDPTTSDHITFTIPGLSGLTATALAVYVLKVPHASTVITDAYGNKLSADVSVTWTHS